MTPSESYEEWLEMVREEDERNRQAFTGERPLTVTEFIHRKADWERAMIAAAYETGERAGKRWLRENGFTR